MARGRAHASTRSTMEDELGFDWIACAEHHYSPFNLAPNVTVLASALTQRVKRAKIAILGALIPLDRQPRSHRRGIRDDRQSVGRAAHCRPVARRALRISRLQRAAVGIALALRGGVGPHPARLDRHHAVRLGGRHYHYRHVSIWPRPMQQPTPPIYVSGSSQEFGEFAARRRCGLGLAFTNLPLAADAARHYRAQAAAEGWEPTPEQIVYQLPVHVGETDEPAFEAVRPVFAHACRGRPRRREPAGLDLGLFRRRRQEAGAALPQPRRRRSALGRGGGRARHHAGAAARHGGCAR